MLIPTSTHSRDKSRADAEHARPLAGPSLLRLTMDIDVSSFYLDSQDIAPCYLPGGLNMIRIYTEHG